MDGIMSLLIDVGIIAGIVVLCYIFKYINSKINVSKNKEAGEWIMTFVSAAEQMYENGTLKSDDRKKFVLDMLKNIGTSEEESILNATIEAAVYALNNDKSFEILKECTNNDIINNITTTNEE